MNPALATIRYLTFSLRGELYALDITEITEIIEYRSLTVVPMMPDFIRGVLNLRGRVLPVVDLAARFGLTPTVVARRTGIIVVQPSGAEGRVGATAGIGVLVDGVHKVMHLEDADIEPPPAFGAGIRSDFIRGMARHGEDDGFIIVLNIGEVLAMDELVRLSRSAARADDSTESALGAPA